MDIERRILFSLVIAAAAAASGCASYRVSSNVPGDASRAGSSQTRAVLLSEDALPNRRYVDLGPVEVSVKKLTIFHANPTKEQANEALVERARALGADAVVKIRYDFGVGFTTWGYMDAKGMAVRFVE